MPTKQIEDISITQKLDETYWFDWVTKWQALVISRVCNNNQAQRME